MIVVKFEAPLRRVCIVRRANNNFVVALEIELRAGSIVLKSGKNKK